MIKPLLQPDRQANGLRHVSEPVARVMRALATAVKSQTEQQAAASGRGE